MGTVELTPWEIIVQAILQWLYRASIEHEFGIGLFCLAMIVTMRPSLPSPFCKVAALEWLWEWLHDTLKAFISFRSPGPQGSTEKPNANPPIVEMPPPPPPPAEQPYEHQ